MPPHRLEFQDADFPHRDAWCWSKVEGLHLRWVPFGMPRLSPHISKSVFFLYEKDPDKPPDSDDYLGPLGTGVIVGMYEVGKTWAVTHYYAVTAAHVAKTGASIIMLNTRDGKKRPMEFDPCEWTADIPWEDVAAVDITDRIAVRPDGDQISYVPRDNFATKEFLSYVEFGIGEDGFMLGLFGEHHGEARNLIAARFGNVSLLADDDAPISRYDPGLKVTFESPCHVFDMHSRPGFSGSPVFVYRTPDGDLRDLERRTTKRQLTMPAITRQGLSGRLGGGEVEVVETDYNNNRFLKLLGIHVGQFQDEVDITKVDQNVIATKQGDELKDGDTIRFPGSMTIIVPIWQIQTLLEHKDLKTQRDARREKAKAADAANPKRGAVKNESRKATLTGPGVDNPDHKEDFMRLLNAAARKRPQDD